MYGQLGFVRLGRFVDVKRRGGQTIESVDA
jgi:hypothetical protein